MTRQRDLNRTSAIENRQSRAYTLIEMLATVAVLIIVLGLMISLARHVRNRASYDLTREMLVKLNELMDEYHQRHAGAIPPVMPIAPAGVPLTNRRFSGPRRRTTPNSSAPCASCKTSAAASSATSRRTCTTRSCCTTRGAARSC